MSFDLLIKNGTVVDGTGGPSRRADVAIANGQIVEIGKIAEGAKKTIDASDLIVAPGFIDPHTHYDAQICWDPYITSSSWHGVTSVIMGDYDLRFRRRNGRGSGGFCAAYCSPTFLAESRPRTHRCVAGCAKQFQLRSAFLAERGISGVVVVAGRAAHRVSSRPAYYHILRGRRSSTALLERAAKCRSAMLGSSTVTIHARLAARAGWVLSPSYQTSDLGSGRGPRFPQSDRPREGMRARRPHGRAETALHGAGSSDDAAGKNCGQHTALVANSDFGRHPGSQ